jgi:hypothetical protein
MIVMNRKLLLIVRKNPELVLIPASPNWLLRKTAVVKFDFVRQV